MVDNGTTEQTLTSLQRAYLLGRGGQLPLGGIAMQEFREYRGRIDFNAFPARLRKLVQAHECLRTRIDEHRLVQVISSEPVVNYEEKDLHALAHAEAIRQVEALREDFAHRLSGLDVSPWQITAFRLPETGTDNAIVFARFDALILDGRSIAMLMVELFGETEPTPAALAMSGAEEAENQSDRSGDAAYWEKKLRPVDGPPRLPWTKPLATIMASRYNRESLIVDRQRYTALSRIGAHQHLFRNSVLTAIVLEILTRWLDEDSSFCAGIPVAPQAASSFSNRSSFIAVNWNGGTSDFTERARELQKDILEGLQHLSFSGVDISRLLMTRSPADGPVLPVVITNALSWPVLGKESTVRQHTGLTQTPQIAMDIRFSNDNDGNLVVDIDYARDAIRDTIVRDFLQSVDRGIAAICAAGALTLQARDFLAYDHYRLNGSESDFVCGGFLQRIADHIFDESRDKDALIYGSRHVAYAELGKHVGRIMASLRARGIGKGSVVAVCLPRSPEHTMLVLACAFIGAIWVPIDAASPLDRMLYLLGNCHPDLVVASAPVADYAVATPDMLLAGVEPADPRRLTLALDELSSSEEAAYYLYTSGTTGKPKCVVLANKATSNVIGQTLEFWEIGEHDVFISVTPLHHDMSVFDIFGCLTAGATLVMPVSGEEKDAIRWNQLIAQHGVTIWCSVPTILEMLLSCRQGDSLKSLRLIAQGGDYIKPATIAELRKSNPDLRLISLGGPTETTIWSIWHEIGRDDIGVIPYGHPLPANCYFLLDNRGEHCPAQVVGRIHTAGVNVALGYLEDGTLSQNDFVTIRDDRGAEVRAFRTGDRGRYREDGTLLFASRVNGYVKIRGVRVSLPDIENELARHPLIRQVLAVDFGDERNGALEIGALYIVESGVTVSTAELRAFARKHLPDSHVPSLFLKIDGLPLSPNGKPDRRQARKLLGSTVPIKAPAQEQSALSAGKSRRRRVFDVYLGVLGKSNDGAANDMSDFITLGLLPSHLKIIAERIRTELGVELSVPQLLRCRNAAQVEQLLPPGC